MNPTMPYRTLRLIAAVWAVTFLGLVWLAAQRYATWTDEYNAGYIAGFQTAVSLNLITIALTFALGFGSSFFLLLTLRAYARQANALHHEAAA